MVQVWRHLLRLHHRTSRPGYYSLLQTTRCLACHPTIHSPIGSALFVAARVVFVHLSLQSTLQQLQRLYQSRALVSSLLLELPLSVVPNWNQNSSLMTR
jgi:hypothetical protein